MRRSPPLLLLVLLTACAPAARTPLPVVPVSLAFTRVSVVDVERGQVLPEQTVLIAGNRIQAVGAAAQIRVPVGAQVVDASGKYLIPGLWDMYAEVFDPRERGEPALSLFVAQGVTGVRDVESEVDLREAARLRNEIATGKLTGPRLIYAGPNIDGPRFDAPPDRLIVHTEAEARAAVDSLARAGAAVIRAHSRLPIDLLRIVIDQARLRGLPMSAWIVTSWKDASDAGIPAIDHVADLYRSTSTRRAEYLALYQSDSARAAPLPPRPDRFFESLRRTRDTAYYHATLQSLARNRTWVVTNFGSASWSLDVFERESAERDRFRSAAQRDTLRRSLAALPANLPYQRILLEDVRDMHRAGVRFLAGGGISRMANGTHGFGLHDALYWLTQAGLTPAEALRTATVYPARFLAATDSVGTIEPGKLADLVLLDGNPLEDIDNTRTIQAVVLNGRYLNRRGLDALLVEAATAAEAPPR